MSDSGPSTAPTRVVGIGASAGGLEALERFFDNLPRETGMAFVVVQHLSPDFKSVMDELLARHTQIPISLVEDGMRVEADRVYLIPSRKEMIISSGRLLLSDRDPQPELGLPIDIFFRSLAQECGPSAVAVVLSGGGSDGSRGIRDVHEAGGLVIVQDVESAQFDGMPRSAQDAGVAHWVLRPEDMPKVILQQAGRPPGAGGDDGDDAEGGAAPIETQQGLAAVYRMLRDEFGIDFTHYKPNTVTRRIERRVTLARSPDIEEYVRRLHNEREELDLLYRDLLIGVTRFFRDPEAFDLLEHEVLPDLLRRGSRQEPLRIWVAGCATGEEAYSLAILVQEVMAKVGERPVKIFATDVHRGSLERAARGLYDEEALANVTPERLGRYFLRAGKMFQVVPDLRSMIVFAQHNVIKDAPFTRVDMVACRNLLIYLQPTVQQKVLSLFHFALNRDGVMFLGPSETASSLDQAFETVDKNWRVYRKHRDVRIPVERRFRPTSMDSRGMRVLQHPTRRYSLSELLGTYDSLLDEVMPPSLLVTDRGELMHAFAGASRFLRPRDGRQDLDVLDLVDTELKMVLVGGLKRALTEASAIVYKGVRLEAEGQTGTYRIVIRRLGQNKGAAAGHLLVTFHALENAGPAQPATETEIDLDQMSRQQLGALEAELRYTKENLQSAIEELETSNAELQASNEELQTSNEELQSTNEELQSVNEELYTVNAEYQRKIAELTELTNDMDNLFASTDIGTVFLDRQLRIRKFTPRLAETFHLVPHDVGRSIETFAYKIDHPELVQDLRQALDSGGPVERELRGADGKWFFLRILPYRVKGTVDGVVLTLIDTTGLKAAEDALFHERYLLDSLLSGVPDAIYFKDAKGKFIRANHAMVTRLGLRDPAEAVGRTVYQLPNQPAAAVAMHKEDEAVLRSGQAQLYRLERRLRDDGSDAWDLVTRLPLRDGEDGIVGVIVIIRDVTEQQRAEAKIQDDVRRRDQFLAMLSHELRNPLGAIATATGLLKSQASARLSPARLMEILDRQAQQMGRLLDDLLEASRVTQNKIELKKQVLDLRPVSSEALDAVRGQLDARGIELTVDIDDEPIHVDADPARLQQIHVNLLSNAAKYTPRDGHVHVTVTRDDEQALISVRDDGVGIPQGMLQSVFDLFVQSSRTLDRSAGGLGVGLTLVRSLVELHGGRVEARSDGEGKGSEFEIRLPLASARASEKPAPAPPRPPLRYGARIMVVEDNPDSREMLCDLLEQAGFECRTAASGVAALEMIEQARPDIVILDVGLPEMDGFEVARRLRSNKTYDGMRLIALTGYGQATDRAVSTQVGFDEHLVKPVQPEQLLSLLSGMQAAKHEEAPAASSA